MDREKDIVAICLQVYGKRRGFDHENVKRGRLFKLIKIYGIGFWGSAYMKKKAKIIVKQNKLKVCMLGDGGIIGTLFDTAKRQIRMAGGILSEEENEIQNYG